MSGGAVNGRQVPGESLDDVLFSSPLGEVPNKSEDTLRVCCYGFAVSPGARRARCKSRGCLGVTIWHHGAASGGEINSATSPLINTNGR
jgi:hypothetical protein